jgi:hypothetical protein
LSWPSQWGQRPAQDAEILDHLYQVTGQALRHLADQHPEQASR